MKSQIKIIFKNMNKMNNYYIKMKIFVEFFIKIGERYQCKIDIVKKPDILALKSSANIF